MARNTAIGDPEKSGVRGLTTLGLIAATVAVFVSVTAIFFLASSVRQEIDALASANSDTTQWSLAQTEVDLLALQVAVHAAAAAEETDLREVRRRFDVFFSRVRTLAESRQFTDLRAQPEARSKLDTLTDFLDRSVVAFDSVDSELRIALPAIEMELESLRSDVRAFSLLGVRQFASASDQRRETVAALLTRIGFLTLLLVGTLLTFVFVLFLLFRTSARAERAAGDARNRLQEVISTSIDGILAVDVDGRIIDYNGAAQRIFGYTREEAIGQDMAELIIPDHLRDAHNAGMERYRNTGERRVVGKGLLRLEAKRKDRSIFPVEVSISSAISDGKEIFVSYLRDISSRVSAEQELIETRDKAVAGEKAKAELLAVMSHEMRTPLNGLLGTMELLEDTDLGVKQRKYLSAMETSANLLLHHVNGVLSISRADSGQLDIKSMEVRPKKLLEELVESQRQAIEANGNKITCVTDSGPERIWSDPLRLRQVFLNLVGNANKFTRNGEIVVESDLLSDGATVEFRVIDNGIGISDEDQGRIFEDFRTLDASYGRVAEGTGLGLGIARRLVHAMGGQIGVESEVGEGSLFWIRLPTGVQPDEAARRASANSEQPIEKAVSATPLSILLVEDNEINRLVARDMLEKAGHEVFEAHDGREGIHAAGQKRFDVILMDISMPQIDGVTATTRIRGESGPNRETPIIALTAHAMPDDLKRFKDAGVTDTLVKPLSRTALNDILGTSVHPLTEPPSSETPSVLAGLKEQLGGNATIALLKRFIEEVDDVVAQLAKPSDGTDQQIRRAEQVHKSAGSASVFAIDDLSICLKQIETALREDSHQALEERIEALERVWTTVRAELQGCEKEILGDECE